MDFTYRYQPASGGLYKGIVWGTEVMQNNERRFDPGTNLPTDRLDEFITLAHEVDSDAINQHVLTYPIAFHPPTSATGGVWTLQLHMDKVAELSKMLFGSDSRYAGE